MQPPLKKQRTDYNPYVEDLLTDNDYNNSLETLFVNMPLRDVVNIIFQSLNAKELVKCGSITKNWYAMINHRFAPIRSLIYKKSINPRDWITRFKMTTIGNEEIKNAFRSIPLNIDLEMHAFTWMPKGVTFNFIVESLIKSHTLSYVTLTQEVIHEYGSLEIEKSGWTIITRSLLPESKNKILQQQLDLIKDLNQKTGLQHEYPKLLKTVIHLVSHHIKFDHLLLDSFTTRCDEAGASKCHHFSKIAVSVEGGGLKIVQDCFSEGFGIAAMINV